MASDVCTRRFSEQSHFSPFYLLSPKKKQACVAQQFVILQATLLLELKIIYTVVMPTCILIIMGFFYQ